MAEKSNGAEVNHLADWARGPTHTGPLLHRFGRAIYNPEDKSFLGRTAKRWGIVITFYLVFYAVLALMFAICMGGLLYSLHDGRPTYTLDQSLIGSNPGVTTRPLPEKGELTIDRSNASSTDDYVEQLKNFFEPYANDPLYRNHTVCVPEDNFGYPETPCLFVKLNRIIDWEPHYYDDASSLPADFPGGLADVIKEKTPAERARIWTWCSDEKTGSSEELEYPWGLALPAFQVYTPGATHKNPIVAVRLKQVTNSTVIRCRLLAKNIIYNKSLKEPSGYSRISINVVDGDGHTE